MRALRKYQVDAVDAIEDHFGRVRSTLLVQATGTGKTVVFAELLRRRRGEGRALVLAHREELVQQAAERIAGWTGIACDVDMGDARPSALFRREVIVASVQTLSRLARREVYRGDEFATIVVDEAHHAVAKQYLEILAYYGDAKVLGVTATPDRLDGRAMGIVFESTAFVYTIRDGIEQGMLCPIRQKSVLVEGLDLSKVRSTRGDLNEAELERALMEDRVLHETAKPTLELAGSRSTILFTAGVDQAHALAKIMNGHAGRDVAVALDGSTPTDERRRVIAAFRAGRVQFLLNCALFTEGFDAPETACVAMARPTTSRALYTQMIGRGTRIANGKVDLLVLDFVGNAGQHSLVSAADVLDGDYSDDVKARATRIMTEDGADLLTAMRRAEEDAAREARRRVLIGARYKTADVDPFLVLGASPRAGRWAGLPATEKQVAFLAAKKISGVYDKGQASALIGKLLERRQRGLCSFPQAKTLTRFGLPPEVSFEKANWAIDEIAATGWRHVPEHVRSDPAFRIDEAGAAE